MEVNESMPNLKGVASVLILMLAAILVASPSIVAQAHANTLPTSSLALSHWDCVKQGLAAGKTGFEWFGPVGGVVGGFVGTMNCLIPGAE